MKIICQFCLQEDEYEHKGFLCNICLMPLDYYDFDYDPLWDMDNKINEYQTTN